MFIKRFVFLGPFLFQNLFGLTQSTTNCREEQFIFELFLEEVFLSKAQQFWKIHGPTPRENMMEDSHVFFYCRLIWLQSPLPFPAIHPVWPTSYTVKKGYRFPDPSRDVTNQTLPGWE